MTRLKAGLSHFTLSLIVFSVVICILLYSWYPAPHFSASGGWQGLRITACVDLVLGPLLTFIVFNPSKPVKTLLLDLSVISLIQVVALSWGVNAIYSQRPVALVFWETDFISVPASAYDQQGFPLEQLKEYGDDYPVLIYAQNPQDVMGLQDMFRIITEEKIPPHHQPHLYRPFKMNFAEIAAKQVDINEIIESNAKMKEDFEEILLESGQQQSDFEYYPLRSKYLNIILLFSHEGELKHYIYV